jgi:glycosyltransferase involved in cell wall biosynthesis
MKALVSIVIPCYNQGRYLSRAIESVLAQTYGEYEILVVDDGSVDNTCEIAKRYPRVRYVYQNNQGLAAARNTGIKQSKGDCLVFLDSDDWLHPEALAINLRYLEERPELAFVSGAYEYFYETEKRSVKVIHDIKKNYYCNLLNRNFISMIAAVMFQKWVFTDLFFDTKLSVCEDYDLYLKIARKYPIKYHTEILAVYRIHTTNMSLNFPLMLDISLEVLDVQRKLLSSEEEKQWLKKGEDFWKSYYTWQMFSILIKQLATKEALNQNYISSLRDHNRLLFFKFMLENSLTSLGKNAKSILPPFILKRLSHTYIPGPGKINFGDLNSTKPFSTQFGYDRGGPVDRYYIENFLEQNKSCIKGRVLEIGDNEYTLRFGEDRIGQSDILHIDDKNPKATFIGDLSDALHLPDNSFDCIVLTQTLHLIYHHQKALETCYRVLKPGGTLLLTVPGISHIDQGEWKDIWLWAFTQSSINRMLSEVFEKENIKTQVHGNVLVATAFLYGIGLPELAKEQMDETDPHYQVIITASAMK